MRRAFAPALPTDVRTLRIKSLPFVATSKGQKAQSLISEPKNVGDTIWVLSRAGMVVGVFAERHAAKLFAEGADGVSTRSSAALSLPSNFLIDAVTVEE